MDEGKLAFLNGFVKVREGLTDKETFEQIPETHECEDKGKSGGNCIAGKGCAKCRGPGAGLCVASSRQRQEQFLCVMQLGRGVAVSWRRTVYTENKDWCSQELISESVLTRIPIWLK